MSGADPSARERPRSRRPRRGRRQGPAGRRAELEAARERFAELVARHQRRAVRIAFHYLRDAADADEAVQDAFVKAYMHLGTFREELPFEVWFTRILINGCLDRLKARRRRERWMAPPVVDASGDERDPAEYLPSRGPSPEDQVLRRRTAPAALGGAGEAAGTAAVGVHVESFRRSNVARSQRHDGPERVDRARALVPGDPAAARHCSQAAPRPEASYAGGLAVRLVDLVLRQWTSVGTGARRRRDGRRSPRASRPVRALRRTRRRARPLARRRAHAASRPPTPRVPRRAARGAAGADPAPARAARRARARHRVPAPAPRLQRESAATPRRRRPGSASPPPPASCSASIGGQVVGPARRPARAGRDTGCRRGARAAAGSRARDGRGPIDASLLDDGFRTRWTCRPLAADRRHDATTRRRSALVIEASGSVSQGDADDAIGRVTSDSARTSDLGRCPLHLPMPPVIFRKGLDMKEAVAAELAAAYHSRLVDDVRSNGFVRQRPADGPSRPRVRLLLRRRPRRGLRLPDAQAVSRTGACS